METTNGEVLTELYRKYRPARFKDIIGQPEAVTLLTRMLKEKRVPHALMLTGPSGTGKTTIARILAVRLNATGRDYTEFNCAEVENPIDAVRNIGQGAKLTPWVQGGNRVWYLDEIQALSRAPFAQQALLKILEDSREHTYFIAASTDPGKILRAVRGRFTTINLRGLDSDNLEEVVKQTLTKEKVTLDNRVIGEIIQTADGSAREALILTQKALEVEGVDEQLKVVRRSDHKRQAFDIVKALLYEKTTWATLAKILSEIDEDAEGLRRFVLACATTELLKANKNAPWAACIVSRFSYNLYDSGRGGLALACYEALRDIKRG